MPAASSPPAPAEHRLSGSRMLASGLASGLIQAIIFHPWDRALYLSVHSSRPFLHASNFVNPFAGATQTVVQRAFSSGLYFPLEEICTNQILSFSPNEKHLTPLQSFIAGSLAGSINGVLMNPAARVKYHYWGKIDCTELNFISTTKEIFQHGGFRPFFNGCTATLSRDLVFGGIFALLRYQYLTKNSDLDTSGGLGKHEVTILAACVATIASAPLNYVRNVHYAHDPRMPSPSAMFVLKTLLEEAKAQKTTFESLHLLQQRLRLGWGTARVGCGMTVGWYIYTVCSQQIEKLAGML